MWQVYFVVLVLPVGVVVLLALIDLLLNPADEMEVKDERDA